MIPRWPHAECVYLEDLTCGTKITPAPECPSDKPVVGEGEMCASILGPVATCAEGFECTYFYPDYGVCQRARGGVSAR